MKFVYTIIEKYLFQSLLIKTRFCDNITNKLCWQRKK